MSTFNGLVDEFPDIRIDYFRKISKKRPPLACFLSHVHSDHLQGLESLRSPFVYCSSATKELLLRLERYPHRMNFAKGILESRVIHYRHLKSLLKTIPLETPTEIELTPSLTIRVTLFDANHCAGAVMFLIDDASNAVLYTGDIRSEPWWVNAISRNPILLPYSSGFRRLDKIYLDTTFATRQDPYRDFPTKADGLQELIRKISRYPENTIFHFHAWTFGYEEVWIALASALRSQIHVDRYKLRLYKALTTTLNNGPPPQLASALCGYQCGNRHQPGCLTDDQSVRLHSCEQGTDCQQMAQSNIVYITPIITRDASGLACPELGAGGGAGDLTQIHELDLSDPAAAVELISLCSNIIDDPRARAKTLKLITDILTSQSKVLSLDVLDLADELQEMPLKKVAELLERIAESKSRTRESLHVTDLEENKVGEALRSAENLPRFIQFPYSRHSSYFELCHLIEAFKPVDVYPCTVDSEAWDFGVSIEALFGDLCSGKAFVHDQQMMSLSAERDAQQSRKRARSNTQSTQRSKSPKQSPFSQRSGIGVDLKSNQRTEKQKDYAKRARNQNTLDTDREIERMMTNITDSTNTSTNYHLAAVRSAFETSFRDRTVIDPSPDLQTTSDLPVHEDSSQYEASMRQQQGKGSLNAHLTKAESGTLSKLESQPSLPDSAFSSQGSQGEDEEVSKAKLKRRKEAYMAASGKGGYDWTTLGLSSLGNEAQEEEVQLR